MSSNQKVQENRPLLKFNFTYKGEVFRLFHVRKVSVMTSFWLQPGLYLYLVLINTKLAGEDKKSISERFKS